ncbi:MAG: hypothetical protein M3N13_07860 [Candidatus Eremiobacteraeota bacterium]|nr:hypothetical protein [Candidatus Eremiobacteraeota bacterium]
MPDPNTVVFTPTMSHAVPFIAVASPDGNENDWVTGGGAVIIGASPEEPGDPPLQDDNITAEVTATPIERTYFIDTISQRTQAKDRGREDFDSLFLFSVSAFS